MSNNVLLKLRNNVWMPKLVVFGKSTLKSNPETYILSKTQKYRYKIYPHLSYKLRNIYGLKTSFSSNIFSFGYVFVSFKSNSSDVNI